MRYLYLLAFLSIGAPVSAQQFTAKASMQIPRHAACMAELNGKLYMVAGTNGLSILADVEEYNPVTNSWTSMNGITTGVVEATAEAINGKVYIFGGYDGSSSLKTTQEWDPATATCVSKKQAPTSRSTTSGATINGKVYITCGWVNNYKVLEIYDPAINDWTTGADIPQGFMQSHGGCVLNGELYIIGGKNNTGKTYDYNYKYNPVSNTWAVLAPLPDSLFSGAVAVLNNKIHVFGGAETQPGNSYLPNHNTHYIYDPGTNTWSTGLPMPVRRSGHCAVTYNNKIYIAGGLDSAGNATNELWEYSEPKFCLQPLSISVSNLLYTWATISWSPSATAIAYEYAIDQTRQAPPTGTITAATTVADSSLSPKALYYVHVRSICGAGDTSGWARDSFITADVAVKNIEQAANYVRLYPNPASEKVTVEIMTASAQHTSLTLCDMKGTVLKNIETSESKTDIDLSALPQGLYLLRYSDGEHQQVVKLTKL